MKLRRLFGTLALIGGLLPTTADAQHAAQQPETHDTHSKHDTWWAAYGGIEGFSKTTFVGATEVLTTHNLQAAGYGLRHYLGRNDHSFETWAFGGNVISHDRDNITARVKNKAAGATAVYNWPSTRGFTNGFVLGEYVRIFNKEALSSGYTATPEQKSSYVLGKLTNFARVRMGVQAYGTHRKNIEASVFPFFTAQMAFGKPYASAEKMRGYSGEGGLQFNFAIVSKRTHLPLVELQAQFSFEGSFEAPGQAFSSRGKAFNSATAFYVNVSPSQIFARNKNLPVHR